MIMGIFTAVLNWFGGGIADKLLQAWIKGKDSKVESERIEAEWARAQLQAMLQVRLATAAFWEMRLLTFMIAFPFALHAFAVGIDTTFSLGVGIPAYPKPFVDWEGAILLSFFGIQGGVTVGKAFAAAIATRRAN